jgi:hypothetical protein
LQTYKISKKARFFQWRKTEPFWQHFQTASVIVIMCEKISKLSPAKQHNSGKDGG